MSQDDRIVHQHEHTGSIEEVAGILAGLIHDWEARKARVVFRPAAARSESLEGDRFKVVNVCEPWLARGDAIANKEGEITLRSRLDGGTTIKIQVDAEAWPRIAPYWEQFEKELQPSPPRRRGGPTPTPEEKRRELVHGWFKVEGTTSKEAYCASTGEMSVSTLNLWIRQMKKKGELPIT